VTTALQPRNRLGAPCGASLEDSGGIKAATARAVVKTFRAFVSWTSRLAFATALLAPSTLAGTREPGAAAHERVIKDARTVVLGTRRMGSVQATSLPTDTAARAPGTARGRRAQGRSGLSRLSLYRPESSLETAATQTERSANEPPRSAFADEPGASLPLLDAPDTLFLKIFDR